MGEAGFLKLNLNLKFNLYTKSKTVKAGGGYGRKRMKSSNLYTDDVTDMKRKRKLLFCSVDHLRLHRTTCILLL